MDFEFTFTNGKKLNIGTMYCIGKNYALHAREMGGEVPKEPIVFLKPATAYTETGGKVKLPDFSDNIHHEAEMVAVIGKDCRNVKAEDALSYVAGYAIGVDLTLRDIQSKAKEKGHPWAVAKGFAGSAPISKIVPREQVKEKFFDIKLYVNGELRQSGNTGDMERDLETLIQYLSMVFYLRAGDCIFTGTPEGVGRILSGDKIEAELCGYEKLIFTAE